jgi:hypothetical protein
MNCWVNYPNLCLLLNPWHWLVTNQDANATGLSVVISAITLYYLIRYARDTRRLANDTHALAKSSLQQLTSSERPFIAWTSKYHNQAEIMQVWAHNQGVGPALDVVATLYFNNGDTSANYVIGCLPVGQKFRFLIGDTSENLVRATFEYKSMSGQKWRTEVTLIGGSSISTQIFDEGVEEH